MATVQYTEDNIRSLDWKEHIRLRPGMYIGKLGNGSHADDGIYVLLKEVIDNSIDEFVMGHGKQLDIDVSEGIVSVRDYGRGIPLGKVVDVVSKINTGGKYDSKAFKKSVGLNGVGLKAVNALSNEFTVTAFRDGKKKVATFERGELIKESKVTKSSEKNGTLIEYIPDDSVFKKYKHREEFIANQLWNYAYLNAGFKLKFNGKNYVSKNAAFREAIVKTVRDFYGKSYDSKDIQGAIVGAISVRVEEPVFESQTKTKLGSINVAPEGQTMRSFVVDFLKKNLDNFLHKNKAVAEALLKRIQQSERERKEIAGIKKLANKRAKVANIHNKKLRDCRVHLNEPRKKDKEETLKATTVFITEGDSASGSITKARDVQTQAVFSLRGKPLNSFGQTKKVVYENEELNLLQHALNIEDGLSGLRYNQVVIATDADVDGMHIRLLLLTFFLQFFPDLVREGHLYILETPLFRVRDKKKTFYCYSDVEKKNAIEALRGKPEITRFKGLGEISPDEFGEFIGEDMRLEPVIFNDNISIHDNISILEVLQYYMGKNSMERQKFIIDNLKVEIDTIEELTGVPEDEAELA